MNAGLNVLVDGMCKNCERLVFAWIVIVAEDIDGHLGIRKNVDRTNGGNNRNPKTGLNDASKLSERTVGLIADIEK